MVSTILVVDDEKNIVQLARLYLDKEGFRVEAAYDGAQALEKAHPLFKSCQQGQLSLRGQHKSGMAVKGYHPAGEIPLSR